MGWQVLSLRVGESANRAVAMELSSWKPYGFLSGLQTFTLTRFANDDLHMTLADGSFSLGHFGLRM